MIFHDNLAVYIHWPYCKSKCPYCDFYKELSGKEDQNRIIDSYLESLEKYHQMLPNKRVQSIFFGGGTPSLIEPRNVARVIDFIVQKWKICDRVEISLEANPNTYGSSLFKDLYNAGINRLSLGVQALNDADLKFLGRTHNVEMARLCLEETVKIFDNHSADLIYARPNQSVEQWQNELAEMSSYGLKHLSFYQLTIEPGTVFARKNVQTPDEEQAALMYNFTRDFLARQGYEHYEISNFAQPNYRSVHNLTYWQGGDYIGIGKSAHGRFRLNKQYIAAQYPFELLPLTPEERAEELIIMGLRLIDGIDKTLFKKLCGLDFESVINRHNCAMLKEQGLICENDQIIRLTYDGVLLCDYVVLKLCSL